MPATLAPLRQLRAAAGLNALGNMRERPYGLDQAAYRLSTHDGGAGRAPASSASAFRDPEAPRAEPTAASAPPQPARSTTSKTSTDVVMAVPDLSSGSTTMLERSVSSNLMLKQGLGLMVPLFGAVPASRLSLGSGKGLPDPVRRATSEAAETSNDVWWIQN